MANQQDAPCARVSDEGQTLAQMAEVRRALQQDRRLARCITYEIASKEPLRKGCTGNIRGENAAPPRVFVSEIVVILSIAAITLFSYSMKPALAASLRGGRTSGMIRHRTPAATAIQYIGGKHPYFLIVPSVVSDYSEPAMGSTRDWKTLRERVSRQTPKGMVSIYCRTDAIDKDPSDSEHNPQETRIAIISPPGVPVQLELDDFPSALGLGWLLVNGHKLSTFTHARSIPHKPIKKTDKHYDWRSSDYDKKRVKLPGGFNTIEAYIADAE